MELPVSTGMAAIALIALVPLTLQVGLKRISTGIFFGDGGDSGLARRRAAQTNFLEQMPLFMAGFILCELNSVPQEWLLGMAGCMLLGRSFHAYSMLFTDGLGNSRAAGMIFTFIAHLTAMGWLSVTLWSAGG